VRAKARNDKIRLLKLKTVAAAAPTDELTLDKAWDGSWRLADASSVGEFSAVGYDFGKELQKTQEVPIGLIHANQGSTPAEFWVKREVLKNDRTLKYLWDEFQYQLDNYDRLNKEFRQKLVEWKKRYPNKDDYVQALRKARRDPKGDYPNRPLDATSIRRPCGLCYGMITPLQPYAIKGVIWYQGESNGNTYKRSLEYRKLFPALIQCWRNDWGRKDLPFLFVQLANTGRPAVQPQENQWGYLREAQTMALSLNHTGMPSRATISRVESTLPERNLSENDWRNGRNTLSTARMSFPPVPCSNPCRSRQTKSC
jgi:sialate O-acetylesterase